MKHATYYSKGYTSAVLSDSEVAFLEEGDDAAFFLFIYCDLFIHSVTWSKKFDVKFFIFHTSGGILSTPAAFLLISSSSVN